MRVRARNADQDQEATCLAHRVFCKYHPFPFCSLRQSPPPSSGYSVRPDSFQQTPTFTNYMVRTIRLGVDEIQN